MKKKSIITMVVAVGLTAAIGVGATLAYLSSTTETMTNTFTVGKVGITQDESNIGTPEDPTDRTDKDQDYGKLEPSQTVVKDPTVTVAADSVDSYVFMNVTGVDAMVSAGYLVDGWGEEWTLLEASGTLDGIYVYSTIVAENKTDAQKLAPLFRFVTLPKDWDGTKAGANTSFGITVQSAAVQATGHPTHEEALITVKEAAQW